MENNRSYVIKNDKKSTPNTLLNMCNPTDDVSYGLQPALVIVQDNERLTRVCKRPNTFLTGNTELSKARGIDVKTCAA